MHEDQIYQKCSCTGHHQVCEHTVNKIKKRENFFFRERSHSDEWCSQMLLCSTSSTWCISDNTAFSFAKYYPSLIQKHILLLYCSIYFPVWDEHYQLHRLFFDSHFCDLFYTLLHGLIMVNMCFHTFVFNP